MVMAMAMVMVIVIVIAHFRIHASVPSNNNLKSRLGVRKYSKCIKTGYLASTSSYCLRELKRYSEMGYCKGNGCLVMTMVVM